MGSTSLEGAVLEESGSTPSHCTASMRSAFLNLGAAFKDALFPGVCYACGKTFATAYPQRRSRGLNPAGQRSFDSVLAGCLCPICRSHYLEVEKPMCRCCGLPFKSPHGENHLCPDCMSHAPGFAEARAAGIYQGGLRGVIYQFKYNGRETLAKPLGRLLWKTLCENWNPGQFDWVVSVPLHPTRLRKRGFNQARALVREWPRLAVRDGFDLPAGWVADGLLVRQRRTEPQTGLKRDRRKANLRGAFRVNTRQMLQSRNILVVDDVMTTGTTADTCARVLLKAGAGCVSVLTLARALP